MNLAPGLYVVNYHDVSYECSVLSRGVGFLHSPEVFSRQVRDLSRVGPLISLDTALAQLQDGIGFQRPTFTFWFDDGCSGVRRFALPILAAYGITSGIAICSRFVQRQEMYWHAMLSALRFADGLGVVRSRLRELGYDPRESLKRWISLNFSESVVDVVRQVYEDRLPRRFRADAFRIYDDEEGIRALADAGWMVSNHTAAHYPVPGSLGADFVRAQFAECADLVSDLYDGPRHLVVPFGCGFPQPTPHAFYMSLGLEGALVDVGRRANTPETYGKDRVVYRVSPAWRNAKAPPLDADALNSNVAVATSTPRNEPPG